MNDGYVVTNASGVRAMSIIAELCSVSITKTVDMSGTYSFATFIPNARYTYVLSVRRMTAH